MAYVLNVSKDYAASIFRVEIEDFYKSALSQNRITIRI
jgi:hypothetical protein